MTTMRIDTPFGTRLFPTDLLFKNFFEQASDFESTVDRKINYPVDIIHTEDALLFEIAAVGLASMENGLLKIEIPVTPESRPKTITIK
jgi:HSP20 family molecular chaperone IbpA